jgi:hypothetical protein
MMEKGNYKERHMAVPIEKHDTAAWADIRGTRRISRVMKPDDMQVENARDYVNENQK